MNLHRQLRHRAHFMADKKRIRKLPKWPVPPHPIGAIAKYRHGLRNYVNTLKEVATRILNDKLPAAYANATRYMNTRTDDLDDDFSDITDAIGLEFEREFTDEDLRQLALEIGISVSELQKRFMKDSFKRVLDIDPLFAEPHLAEFLSTYAAANVGLVRSVEDRFFGELHSLVFTAFQQGQRYEELSAKIQDRFAVAQSRADLIAADQVGKLYGALDRLRMNNLGLNRYVWRTMMDERVREEHQDNEGEIFSYDDPPADTGNPKEDYRCRCWAEPVPEDLEALGRGDEPGDQGQGEDEGD